MSPPRSGRRTPPRQEVVIPPTAVDTPTRNDRVSPIEERKSNASIGSTRMSPMRTSSIRRTSIRQPSPMRDSSPANPPVMGRFVTSIDSRNRSRSRSRSRERNRSRRISIRRSPRAISRGSLRSRSLSTQSRNRNPPQLSQINPIPQIRNDNDSPRLQYQARPPQPISGVLSSSIFGNNTNSVTGMFGNNLGNSNEFSNNMTSNTFGTNRNNSGNVLGAAQNISSNAPGVFGDGSGFGNSGLGIFSNSTQPIMAGGGLFNNSMPNSNPFIDLGRNNLNSLTIGGANTATLGSLNVNNVVNSDNPELDILKCNICFRTDYSDALLCKNCTGQACRDCWNRIDFGNRQCPYCKSFINMSELVRNRFVNEVRDMLNDPNRNNDGINKTCPTHDLKGALYCETCLKFVCKECIKKGTHNGHEVNDIEEKSELKEKIKNIDKFKSKIDNIDEKFKDYKKSFKKYYDINEEELTWMGQRLKQKINEAIDDVIEERIKTVQKVEKKYDEFCKDSELLGKAKKEVLSDENKTLEIDEIKDGFTKFLHQNKCGEIAKLIKEDGNEVDIPSLMNLYNLPEMSESKGAYSLLFTKSILSKLKSINTI
ncbi:unnamed protein product [Moneuplotes crassus]|uniref:B box-type domain-containing protein n=1 Tax=Euplotes crassus TaxID=5936 RepID=A0AAD1XZG5_EUPCR|nr:unnamed protein product [Moneuplotes crassus]